MLGNKLCVWRTMKLKKGIKPAIFGMGQPTSYLEDYCELLVEHMAGGLSFESFAGLIDVSNKTLYAWTEKHEAFLHAKERGKDRSRLWWERKTVEGLFDETSHEVGEDGKRTTTTKRMNGSVYRLNMVNRFRGEWSDTQRTEVTGPNGKPIQHQHQVQVQRVQDALGKLPSDELRHLVDITDKVNQTDDEPVKQLN